MLETLIKKVEKLIEDAHEYNELVDTTVKGYFEAPRPLADSKEAYFNEDTKEGVKNG